LPRRLVARDAHRAPPALLLLLARLLRRRAGIRRRRGLRRRVHELLPVVVAAVPQAGDHQAEQKSFHPGRPTVPPVAQLCLFGFATVRATFRAMKVLKEFREFINKGNVVDLAVAVVIGGAFGKIVSALVADMVMPLVNAVMPEGDWRKWEVTPLHFRIGDFLGTVVDFTIVAFVVFLVMVKLMGAAHRRLVRGAAAATKACPECLEMVPIAARRCRACTSVLVADAAA